MITVSPERDKERIKALYAKAGAAFDGDCGCVTARDGEEVLGFCLYSIKDGTVTVHDVSPRDDILLADGVLRSALHVASERFVFKANYDNPDIEALLLQLGFIKDKKTRAVDIDKLFRGCECEQK